MFRKYDNSNYSLRSNNLKLSLPKPKTNFLKRSFSCCGAVAWNSLPSELIQMADESLSYLSFEEIILMAQMNKTDVGDVNHSRKFATKIDKNLSAVMREDFKDALQTKLEATGQLRPLGFAMDKITPNKQTGQVDAMITPVPENPLSEDLIVPVMISPCCSAR